MKLEIVVTPDQVIDYANKKEIKFKTVELDPLTHEVLLEPLSWHDCRFHQEGSYDIKTGTLRCSQSGAVSKKDCERCRSRTSKTSLKDHISGLMADDLKKHIETLCGDDEGEPATKDNLFDHIEHLLIHRGGYYNNDYNALEDALKSLEQAQRHYGTDLRSILESLARGDWQKQ